MELEVITPEKKMFKGEVAAVRFPGTNGSFQVLKGHAPIVSTLTEGSIKVDLPEEKLNYDEFSGSFEVDSSNPKIIRLTIKGGVMEMQNDKIIVLAD